MSLTVLYPTLPNTVDQARLDRVLDRALAGRQVRLIRRSEDLSQLQGERILFALSLDEAGQNFEYYRMLARLRPAGPPPGGGHRLPGQLPHPGQKSGH